MMFKTSLTNWYSDNKRVLPWRLTPTPYSVWLSEIILQQTQVKQGLPYYTKFITKYPTLNKLANADEDQVLKMWQGLGYYSRARNLLTTAKFIYNNLNGVFPNNYQDLIKLKGVGPYTAAAIASICFNEAVAVVDGNVYRVLARSFNINTATNSTNGIKEFKTLAQSMLDVKNPGEYNQAIMELGALICTPGKPKCNECPLNNSCLALKNKTINKLPAKLKKQPIKKRYFNYLVVITDSNKIILNKRLKKDIWLNLYEFPLIESKKPINIDDLVTKNYFKSLFSSNNYLMKCFNEIDIVSKLTHQHIFSKFWIIKIKIHPLAKTRISEISNFAVPIHIHNFIKTPKFKKYGHS